MGRHFRQLVNVIATRLSLEVISPADFISSVRYYTDLSQQLLR